jgi:hypothetical protein
MFCLNKGSDPLLVDVQWLPKKAPQERRSPVSRIR